RKPPLLGVQRLAFKADFSGIIRSIVARSRSEVRTMAAFARWLRFLLGSPRSRRRGAVARRQVRHRPTLELLETRALLDGGGNSPPVLMPIDDFVLPHTQGAMPVDIVVYDPNGDPPIYIARLIAQS